MFRVCCPCCYKRLEKDDTEFQNNDDPGKKGHSNRKPSEHSGDEDGEGDQNAPPPKYSTIGQLTSATVVMAPPPMFAKFMLRKSVDRLNSEVRVDISGRFSISDLLVLSVSGYQSISFAFGRNQRETSGRS